MFRIPIRYTYACIMMFIALFALSGCGQGFQSAGSENASLGSTGSPGAGGNYHDPVQAPTNGELLKNQGFENGLTEWEDWGNSSLLSGGGHTGQNAVRIGSDGGLGQEVIFRLIPGATYKLTGFARKGSSSDSAKLGIRFFDATNGTLGDVNTPITSTSYSSYSVTFTVPISVSSAKIYVSKANSSSTFADFDDLSLKMTVEAPPAAKLPVVNNSSNLMPTGPSGSWNLVFNDSFDSGSLNTSVWNTGLWFNSTINNELEAYRPENVQIKNGSMNLVAENRSTATTWGQAMNYASGAVTTKGKLAFTFGAVEARIKLPKGQGLMSLFQIQPSNKRAPPEINMLHELGQTSTSISYNYTYFDFDGTGRIFGGSVGGADFSTDYHVFTLEWLETSVRFYVDGVLHGSYTGESVLRDPGFLVMSLAVGGNEAGSPTTSTGFPQSYSVDYVRIWQRP
jgi:hypothetical protein